MKTMGRRPQPLVDVEQVQDRDGPNCFGSAWTGQPAWLGC